MSTKLGTLTLDLVAKIGNFIEPVKKGEKQVESSFSNMQKSVNKYGVVAIAGAAAVGASVFAMANEYADAARELQIFASISNTTTQEFQKMAVGAQTMGISQEKLSDQIKDFNEKLGEFVTIGSGGAVDFFEQIATKTEGSAEGARKLALEMQNLSGPQALQLYVDKLEEAGVTQQQMSFYLESMASDTTNLIPLLKNGGEGFRFWADAAEKAGVIMDEHAIEKAAELRVQMDLLNLQVKGAKNQFIQGLMPALVSVGDSLTDATTETNLMADAGKTLGNVFLGVAATGMGVYAVVKMLSNAIAGLSFDAINAKKNVDLAAEKGTWADKIPGVKLAKTAVFGATMMRAPGSGVSMAIEDNAKVAEDIGTTITNLFKNTTSEAVKAMTEIQNSQAGVTKGSDEWIKKQNESAKAASGANKALQEQNRLIEEQARNREQISKAYNSDYQNLKWDESEQRKLVSSSGFSSEDQAKYLALVERRYNAESAEYFKKLNLDINNHKWSEEKKLEYSYQMDREILENDVRVSDEVREVKLKALDEQYAIELQKTRFHAQNMRQAMQESISSLGVNTDDIFAKATMSPQDYDLWSLKNDRSNAQVDLKSQRVGVEQDIMTSDVYSTDDERYEALLQAHQEYRDAMAAIDVEYAQEEQNLIQSQHDAQMNIWQDLLTRTGTVFSQMAEMVKNTSGESSAAYKAMFLTNQAISIAQAMVNTEVAATKAMAEGGYIAGIPMSTAIRALGYASVGMIGAQTIAGMAHDGIDNVPKEGTWLLDRGERVVDSRTNADLKNYLSHQKQQAPKITINNNANADVTTRQNSDGSIDIDLIERQLANRLGSANSVLSKSLKQNTTASRRR